MASILIIDDSKVQRLFARGALENAGYQVVEAANGEAGLQCIRAGSPDAVLLDLVMPDLSGFDVLEQLGQEGIAVKVVAMSADVDEEIRRRCIDAGAVNVIDKPNDFEAVVRAIEAALDAG